MVEWWNGGMVVYGYFMSSILFACLSTNYYSMVVYFRQSCFSTRLRVFVVVVF